MVEDPDTDMKVVFDSAPSPKVLKARAVRFLH